MKAIRPYLIYIVWVTALAAMIGSLYFQYVQNFTPCTLCWYQRIFIYPLVFIVPIGIIKKDRAISLYTVTLSALGTIIAIYHNLLYYKIIPETIAPCITGVSCTTRYIDWLGFVDIPFLSLISFLIILVCSIIILRHKTND